MKPNRCMDCPRKQTSFLTRICKLTGKPIPLFSEPVDCPLVVISETETTSSKMETVEEGEKP